MNYLKSFTKDTVYYGIGNAIKKFISFLLLPIYTRALTPSDYGVLETLGTSVLFLSILFGLKITDGGSRYYYETYDKKEKGIILFTVFVLNFMTMIPAFIIGFFSNKISVLLFQTDKYTWVVFASALSIPLVLINDEQSWVYRYKRKPWNYNIYILLRTILNMVFGLFLVVYLRKGVLGAQIASVIGLLITILFSLITFTFKEYAFHFSSKWAKKLIRFSYPLMLSGLIGWVYSSADRYLLLGYKSAADIGLYSIGATFARPITMINMAMGMSFYPFFMTIYENEKDQNKYETKNLSNQIWYLYLAFGLSFCSVLSIFGKELIGIIATPVYVAGASVIPLLIYSQIFRQSIEITSLGIFLKEKTIHYTWLAALTSAVSLGLNFLLIPKLSYQGAALSNMISNLVYFFIAYNLSQRFFYVERNIKRVIIYFTIILIISNIIPILEINFSYSCNWLIKLFITVFCLFLPFILKIISYKSLMTFIVEKFSK